MTPPDLEVVASNADDYAWNVSQVVGDIKASRNGFALAACVTVYNEPLDDIVDTMRSLVQAISQTSALSAGAFTHNLICIIMDGPGRPDDSYLALLDRIPFAGHDPVEDLNIYLSNIDAPLSRFLKLFPRKDAVDTQILIIEKLSNRGKLDSHAIFFPTICGLLNPVYCAQVDAGTLVRPDAIRLAFDHLNHNPEVAGLAPTILVDRPERDSLLGAWQYMNFIVQSCMDWPLEDISGGLSVLPGQLCFFRWSALKGDAASAGVVEKYTHGLQNADAFERLKYLTEDRVIAAELIMNSPRASRLRYLPPCEAKTDACLNWASLFRQRRRWINGAVANRLSLAHGGLSAALARSHAREAGRRPILICLFQILMLARQVLNPAIIVSALLSVISAAALTLRAKTGEPAVAIGVGAALLIAAIAIRSRTPAERRLDNGFLEVAVFVTLCLAVLRATSWWSCALLFAPAVALFAMIRRHFPGRRNLSAADFASYLFVNPIIDLAISVYAMVRLHDLAWGTRGLLKEARHRPFGRAESMAFLGIKLSWLAANAGLILLSVSQTLRHPQMMNTVTIVSQAYVVATTVIALAFPLQRLTARAGAAP